MNKPVTYLALGDSYTIGEGVLLIESFPYQLCQLLRSKGHPVHAPEIVAKTGWTTDELLQAMEHYQFLEQYSLVTVLTGVNNQYRGRMVEEYKIQFEHLLKNAIHLAGHKRDHVIVISIPDYGVTPFAQTLNKEKIAKEIDLFNSVNRAVSAQYKVQYVNVTEISRISAGEDMLAADKLHPSGKQYKLWAEIISDALKSLLK